MATWIVHLRLAENLLKSIEGLDAPSFAIGSIAPDSGIPDENWERFTPPPEVSHFAGPPDEDGWRTVADLEFYRRHLATEANLSDDPARFSFLLGYFFHLVTDSLWNDKIGRPTHRRFAAQFAADPQFIWEIKRDWYGLDFQYVRNYPDSLFWRVFLGCACQESYLDFMPVEAVQQRIEYIQSLYQREDEKIREHYIDRPDLYLSREEMDRFVTETTRLLGHIYRLLWKEDVDTAVYASVLELPLDI